jgi:hypothetical protein
MGEGSRRQLTYIAEVTPGTSPASGYAILRNLGGAGITVNKQTLVSNEFRSDRAITSVRHGNKTPVLDVPFELSYTSFNTIMEAALFSSFVVAYALTGLTVTVVAGTTKTFACATATFVTSGIKVGDKITTTGFAAAGNNGTFVVSAVEEALITCATATGLEAVTDDTGVGITTDRYVLKQGSTAKYLSIEEGFTDIAQYQVMAGALCNGMTLAITPNAMVTGSFSFLGLSATAFSGTSIDSSPDAAPTTQPFDSFTGSLLENNIAIATVTALNLNLQNGNEHYFALFDVDPYKIGYGRANLTGSISVYFENATLAAKFLAETVSSLECTLTDLAGNSLIIKIPALKYTGANKSMTENNVLIDLPFQAYYDATQATALRIDRKPA